MKKVFILFSLMAFISQSYSQTYPDNESSLYEDMLTPEYYNTPGGGAFRNELNKYVHFARLVPFQHPLTDSLGNIPTYTVPRGFGDGVGPGGTSEHHNAFDMHVGSNNDSNVTMFASIDGVITTFRDAAKYRDYLTITKDVEDSLGNVLGKIVVVYGHIDLNLDSLDNIILNGQYVNQGDIVSKHLYSGTLGGAHLHFEIRYYRINDIGNEEFYGSLIGPNPNPNLTDPSTGSWIYGYWDPNLGYGFAHPNNHLNTNITSVKEQSTLDNNTYIYPNPVENYFVINLPNNNIEKIVIYNTQGQLVETLLHQNNSFKYNISGYKRGLYLVKIGNKSFKLLKE